MAISFYLVFQCSKLEYVDFNVNININANISVTVNVTVNVNVNVKSCNSDSKPFNQRSVIKAP